jgi:hypothetical protein
MLAEIAALALAMGASSLFDFKAPALYRPHERAVSNWRLESARNLDAPLEALAKALTKDSAKLPRCVRLNNYWCVKSARWNGEIATDREGHVAFASAREGALVAAQLLRRYYVDLGRTSARAIVTRWAPAECGTLAAAPLRVARAGATRPDALSTRGIGNTLRARWLASKGKGGKVVAASKIPTPRITLMRAPSIAPNLGESAKPLPAMTAPLVRLASLGVPDKLPTVQSRLQSCPSESVRIRNYAAKVFEGVADGPDADLKLFDATGLPTPALARVMANMAAVEIGPMKPDFALIEKVVAEQTAAWRGKMGGVSSE